MVPGMSQTTTGSLSDVYVFERYYERNPDADDDWLWRKRCTEAAERRLLWRTLFAREQRKIALTRRVRVPRPPERVRYRGTSSTAFTVANADSMSISQKRASAHWSEVGSLSRDGIQCCDDWSHVSFTVPLPECDEAVDYADHNHNIGRHNFCPTKYGPWFRRRRVAD